MLVVSETCQQAQKDAWKQDKQYKKDTAKQQWSNARESLNHNDSICRLMLVETNQVYRTEFFQVFLKGGAS